MKIIKGKKLEYKSVIIQGFDTIQRPPDPISPLPDPIRKEKPPQQPHTFAIFAHPIPQALKLQKNAAAPPKKDPLKKTKYFWYVALKYRHYVR